MQAYGLTWVKGILALLWAFGPALAQPESRVSGPWLGIVFDPALNGLRPLLGIPGAAHMGRPLDLGMEFTLAAISPGQDYVLAVGDENQEVLLFKIKSVISQRLVEGVPAGPQRIILSPTGSAAALYYPEMHKLLTLTGLPESPSISGEIDLRDFPSAPTAMAISDNGDALLAGFTEGETVSVFALGARPAQFVLAVTSASAIAFANKSRDALIADDQDNKVYLARAVDSSAGITTVAGANDGVDRPIAVAFSGDGQWAIVANSGTRTIAMFDLGGGVTTLLSCQCAPTGLHRVGSSDLFRLTELSDEPLWFFDGDGRKPRVTFVPPDVTASETKFASQQ